MLTVKRSYEIFHTSNCGFFKSSKLWSSRWSPDFFRLLFAQNCDDHSLLDLTNPQFNVWIISYITSHSFLTAGSIEPTNDQLLTSVGSHSHLVRALHQYREVTGSNPVGVLTFSGFSTQLLKCVQNCDDHSLLDFKSALQYMKYSIYRFTLYAFCFFVFFYTALPCFIHVDMVAVFVFLKLLLSFAYPQR